MKQRGFTLVELLAAMILLALLAGILMGTVRGAERSTGAANDLSERTEQYARTQAFLSDHIIGTLPLRWRREVGQPLKFAGTHENLTYLAPVTSQIAEGGVLWWQLAVAKGPKQGQLVLRRVAPDPEEKTVPDLSSADPIVLADHIDSMTISYFDPGEDPLTNPDSGTWVDDWNENARMPSMLRISVVETPNRRWPDLVIPFRLTQAMGCNWDFQRQRCIIQGTVNR